MMFGHMLLHKFDDAPGMGLKALHEQHPDCHYWTGDRLVMISKPNRGPLFPDVHLPSDYSKLVELVETKRG
jgi:hypothetical protein